MPSPETIDQFIELTLNESGALLSAEGIVQFPVEIDEKELKPYRNRVPSPTELQARRALARILQLTLYICKEEHPSCLETIEVLRAFAQGKDHYRELAVMKARLHGRATMAGICGIKHDCVNAPPALIAFHACTPDFLWALEHSQKWFRRTIEFALLRRKATNHKGRTCSLMWTWTLRKTICSSSSWTRFYVWFVSRPSFLI